MSSNIKNEPSEESKDFFESLTKENEQKYINYIKSSSIKFWNYFDDKGLSSLHKSISLHLYDLSRELIISAKNKLSKEEFNLFINYRTNKGQTPLHYASFVGDIKLIKLLIQNGADISIKTNNNFNPLHLASMGNKVTSLYYFIKQYKIDVNSKDTKDNTCFHLATFFNSKKVFNYLLTNKNIDINSKNKGGFTPLHYAVISKNKSMVKKLLMKGANCSVKNDKLESPYELAVKNKDYYIQNLLKSSRYKYSILKYSQSTKIFLIIISLVSLSFIFYIKFDIRSIIYISWLIIFLIFIFRFYLIDTTKFNNNQNYLLNLLVKEEQSIEDYCLNCQIKQNSEIIHCLICNKCIEGFDHHCYWLNKCVGEKNINSFYHLLWAMQTHSFINFVISITGRNGKFNEDVYFKDYIMLVYIVFNGLNFIFTSIAVCPLIKFYCTKIKKIKDKNTNYIPQISESKIGVRIPNSSDEDEIV
jgi:ankyrin repeat protein